MAIKGRNFLAGVASTISRPKMQAIGPPPSLAESLRGGGPLTQVFQRHDAEMTRYIEKLQQSIVVAVPDTPGATETPATPPATPPTP